MLVSVKPYVLLISDGQEGPVYQKEASFIGFQDVLFLSLVIGSNSYFDSKQLDWKCRTPWVILMGDKC